MLKIFYELYPFFEDNYIELSIREYAKKIDVSPPTAAKTLKKYFHENLLNKREERRTYLYSPNRTEKLFQDLQKIYYFLKIKNSELLKFIEENYYPELVLIFGSAVKAELKKDSDIDLLILTKGKKEVDLKNFEKRIGRKIQLFTYKNTSSIPKLLKNNLKKGYVIYGGL